MKMNSLSKDSLDELPQPMVGQPSLLSCQQSQQQLHERSAQEQRQQQQYEQQDPQQQSLWTLPTPAQDASSSLQYTHSTNNPTVSIQQHQPLPQQFRLQRNQQYISNQRDNSTASITYNNNSSGRLQLSMNSYSSCHTSNFNIKASYPSPAPMILTNQSNNSMSFSYPSIPVTNTSPSIHSSSSSSLSTPGITNINVSYPTSNSSNSSRLRKQQQQQPQQQLQHQQDYHRPLAQSLLSVSSPVNSLRDRPTSFLAMEGATIAAARSNVQGAGGGTGGGSSSNNTSPSTVRLGVEDARKDLHRRGLECPDSMWREPQPEQIQGLFSFAIDEVFGKTITEIRVEELAGELMTSGAFGETSFMNMDGRLHLKSIGNLRWYRYCQKLAKNVLGMGDFTRAHIFSPTPHSLHRFAIALCTFLRVRDTLVHEFEPLLDQWTSQQQKEQQLCQELQQSEHEVFRLRVEKDAQYQQAIQLRQQREAVQSAIRTLELEADTSQDKNNLLHKQQQRIQLELRQAMEELSRLHEQQEDLTDQIVHSPEKLMQRRNEMIEEQRQLQIRVARVEDQLRLQRQLQQQVARALKKTEKALGMLSNHKKEVIEPHSAFRQTLRSLEKTHKELHQQKKQQQQQQLEKQHQLQQLQRQHESEYEQQDENRRQQKGALEALENEENEFNNNLRDIYNKIKNLEARSEYLDVEIIRQQRQYNILIDKIGEAEQQQLGAFRNYVARAAVLCQSIDEIPTAEKVFNDENRPPRNVSSAATPATTEEATAAPKTAMVTATTTKAATTAKAANTTAKTATATT